MHWISPRARAGLNMLDASSEPLAPPAPTISDCYKRAAVSAPGVQARPQEFAAPVGGVGSVDMSTSALKGATGAKNQLFLDKQNNPYGFAVGLKDVACKEPGCCCIATLGTPCGCTALPTASKRIFNRIRTPSPRLATGAPPAGRARPSSRSTRAASKTTRACRTTSQSAAASPPPICARARCSG